MERDIVQEHVQLAEKARGGDTAAFAQLYELYRQPLYRTAYAILRNPQDAQDAVMDTVTDAFDSIASLRSAERFENWLFKILYNKARRMAGKVKRAEALPLLEEILPGMPDLAPDAVDSLDLSRALDMLNAQERAVLALCVCQEMKSADAAEILGMNAATVRSNQMRALAKLRQILAGEQ